MAVDNFQSFWGGGGGGGAIKTGGACSRGRAPSCPQIEGLGERAVILSFPNGVWGEAPAALTFSLFVISKNLTLNAEIDPALYGIAIFFS